MNTHPDLVRYVHEELENIRAALVDSEVPFLVATERTLRPATCRLLLWLDAVDAGTEDACDELG